VLEARRWIGTPYVHQASLLGAGTDCLGLVRGVWRALLGPEPEAPPPYTPDWAEAQGRETLLEAAGRWLVPIDAAQYRKVVTLGLDPRVQEQLGPRVALRAPEDDGWTPGAWTPGAVLVFRWRPDLPAKHCAIAAAPGWIIHSLQGHAVQEVQLPRAWRRRIAAAFVFPSPLILRSEAEPRLEGAGEGQGGGT